MSSYSLTHLQELEAEAIYVIREVYAQFDNPAILFSGGKDSIVVAHLARKAFFPAKIPFPFVHIDTGHNFPETMAFRNQLIKDLGVQLVVGSVQESIDEGAVAEETGINASRNALQTTTLLDTIERNNFDACMGGARRDEEKARAKERFFSHRDDFGQWDPKTSVPSFGTCSTVKSAWEKTFACSLSPTGRRWMSGNTSSRKTSPFQNSTLPKSATSSGDTVPGFL